MLFMGEIIRQSELRNNNAEIMRRVADGESFTITVHGRPVANLVPHQRQATSRLVPTAEIETRIAQLAPIDGGQWYRDIREEGDHIFGDDLPTDPWRNER